LSSCQQKKRPAHCAAEVGGPKGSLCRRHDPFVHDPVPQMKLTKKPWLFVGRVSDR
jgi:hypothetical protein